MDEILTYESVIKDINKKFGDARCQVVTTGVCSLGKSGTLSLGSPSLDFCLYNSLYEGIMIEIAGSESSGKTTLSFLIAQDYIKKELERNPENPRHILFVDAECACDPDWALRSTGYDMNRNDVKTIYATPTGQSAEEIFDWVVKFVKTGDIGLVIFDSLTAIVSQQIADQSMTKKDMGGIAKPLGDFCKKIIGLLHKNKTTFIGINGLTENVEGYGEAEITPGGRTWKRACMVRLRAKRGDFFNEFGDIIPKKDAQSPAGNKIEVYVYKTKVCPWDRKLGTCTLNYSQGIDILEDTIDVATAFGFIDNSTQGIFKIVDPETGEMMNDSAGNPIKIRGKKNVKPFFLEHKELWKTIYDLCYERMSTKQSNVKTFEEMLNINVSERLGVDLVSTDPDTL